MVWNELMMFLGLLVKVNLYVIQSFRLLYLVLRYDYSERLLLSALVN
jgi:hypothetical protein